MVRFVVGDRKPTLTDEEESGSSTSSCEEPLRGGVPPVGGAASERERHSSDTASAAESPPAMMGGGNGTGVGGCTGAKKDEYDSSATETADEAVTPDNYQVIVFIKRHSRVFNI